MTSRLTLVAPLVVAVAVIATGVAGYRMGQKAARTEAALHAEKAYRAAEARYRELEKNHADKITSLQTQYAKAAEQARQVDTKAVSDLGSGRKRLRFRTTGCPPTPATSPTSPRTDAVPTAELAPEVAAALYSIAADGDDAIRKLTALQSWAREAVVLCGDRN